MLWKRFILTRETTSEEDDGWINVGQTSSSSNIDKEIANEMEMEKDRLWAHPRHALDSHNEHYASELPSNK